MPKTITPLKLTDIANAKAEQNDYKLRDGGGLYLLVTRDGSKGWRFDYRRPDSGRRNTISVGTYPEISLKRAREIRGEHRRLLSEGTDPGKIRALQKQANALRAANSLEIIAREYEAMKANQRTDGTARRALAWLEQHIFPQIGARPIDEIDAPELLEVLRRLVKRGTLDSANRIRAELSAIFRYAITTGRAKRDPAGDLRDALPKPRKQHFASMTDPAAIADLLRSIDMYQGDPLTLAALRLSPVLFQRPGELRNMEWHEVDLPKAEWRIPATKQKLPRAAKENPRTPDHIVPLPTQAIEILKELQQLSGRSRYVFPGRVSATRPMSENTVRSALRRLGYTNEDMTPHGFRHMACSRLNEMDFNPDAIEVQLSHTIPGGSVRRTYNKAQYLDERRKMMQDWADYLDQLRAGCGGTITSSTKRARPIAVPTNH